MAFSQSTILGEPVCSAVGRHLRVEWSSSSPIGTLFQVYLDRKLAWSGDALSALFSLPIEPVEVEVGTVAMGEAGIDFSADLPAGSPCRATLNWTADPTVAGFRVYGSLVAGGPVSYAKVLEVVPATVAGVDISGFGLGGFGVGGFGFGLASYDWTSSRLGSGVWSFAVQAFDSAGNASGSPLLTSVAIVAPPRPPAPFSDGSRLDATVIPQRTMGFGSGGFGVAGFGGLGTGFGVGPFGTGGFGNAVTGFGVGGFGVDGFGLGAGWPTVVLSWNASPGG